MSYQIIPLDGNFDDSNSYKVRFTETKYGNSAFKSRAKDGINSSTLSRSVAQSIVGVSKKLELETFIKAHKGYMPFYYSPYSDNSEPSTVLYTCNSFSFAQKGVEIWEFQAEFKRVYRLKT